MGTACIGRMHFNGLIMMKLFPPVVKLWLCVLKQWFIVIVRPVKLIIYLIICLPIHLPLPPKSIGSITHTQHHTNSNGNGEYKPWSTAEHGRHREDPECALGWNHGKTVQSLSCQDLAWSRSTHCQGTAGRCFLFNRASAVRTRGFF